MQGGLMLGGFYLRVGSSTGALDAEVNAEVQRLARTLLETPHPALTDVIPGYHTLYLEYDLRLATERALRAWLDTQRRAVGSVQGRTVSLEVTYDGPDMAAVAEHTGLSPAEVSARHSARPYRIYAVGFTPGLAFMGDLEPALRLPRRAAPRPHVAANTVAITGAQTTVYPVASPGGWHLLGRTHRPVYDPLAAEPLLLAAGDRVQFVPSRKAPPEIEEEVLELLPAAPSYPLLRVAEPGLLDLVVDAGRFRSGRFGFARGGPLDASAAALANRLVGNPVGTALLELNVQGGVYEVLADGVMAFCGGGLVPQLGGEAQTPYASFTVRAGDRLTFRAGAQGSRGYLACAGGLESATFRDSASVDLRGRVGRPLRAGDVLGVVTRRLVRPGQTFRPFGMSGPLRLLPGPQASAEALGALTRQTFTVGRADRMGVQLTGGAVPGGELLSEAVPIGSVQVPPGGTPLLLLHDRGTLGGYSKPALVHPADLGRAAQLRTGETVRFTLVRDYL